MYDFTKVAAVLAGFFILQLVSTERRSPDVEIYGGNRAADGQFPYQVYVHNTPDNEICGGVIYDAMNVITAAHCVNDDDSNPIPPDYFTLYVGSTVRGDGDAYSVSNITTYPDWQHGDPRYDIAIIRLNNPIQMSQDVQPLATQPESPKSGDPCVLSGWGSLKTRDSGTVTDLRYAKLSVVPDSQCYNHYDEYDPDTMVCAGGKGTNACAGDSGGPLACQSNGQTYLAGTVSFGPNDCTTKGFPSTFTKTSSYLQWIVQTAAD